MKFPMTLRSSGESWLCAHKGVVNANIRKIVKLANKRNTSILFGFYGTYVEFCEYGFIISWIYDDQNRLEVFGRSPQ